MARVLLTGSSGGVGRAARPVLEEAAEICAVSRVVYFSSAQVFGFAEGEGTPAYLPVDDAHPLRAARPHGMSKRLAEDMCAAWTSRTGIPTTVLRPVMILTDPVLLQITQPHLAITRPVSLTSYRPARQSGARLITSGAGDLARAPLDEAGRDDARLGLAGVAVDPAEQDLSGQRADGQDILGHHGDRRVEHVG